MSRRGLSLLAAAFLVASGLLAPARALVGASQDGAAVASNVVMVLNHRGRLAGYCSGLVLAPTVVLTAAHCVPPGSDVRIHFRALDNAGVLLQVAAVEAHPGYRANAIRTRERSVDLALVRLRAPLPDQFRPRAVGIAQAEGVGLAYRVAGFGLTREGDPLSSGQLRTQALVSQAPLSRLLLWARDPDGMGGACTGDSGGPVFDEKTDAAVALMVWSSGPGASQCGALTQAIWLAPQKAWIDGVLARWGAVN